MEIVSCIEFQSTLSVRRATHFLPLSPTIQNISIHALREESDIDCVCFCKFVRAFQSTLSVRRATRWFYAQALIINRISIHALREESDNNSCRNSRKIEISIHALREESDSKIQHNIYS